MNIHIAMEIPTLAVIVSTFVVWSVFLLWVNRPGRSQGLGAIDVQGMFEALVGGAAAIILSLIVWLSWALFA